MIRFLSRLYEFFAVYYVKQQGMLPIIIFGTVLTVIAFGVFGVITSVVTKPVTLLLAFIVFSGLSFWIRDRGNVY